MNKWEVYTDGAYSSSRNQGGVGLVFVKEDKVVFKYNKSIKNTTNNRCELYAVIKAIQSITKPIDELVIYSDSQYVIYSITKGWQRKKNKDLWKTFDYYYDQVKKLCPVIRFEWVKGHATNVYNQVADLLAVEASHES